MLSDRPRTTHVCARFISQPARAWLAAMLLSSGIAFGPATAAADFQQASDAYARGDYTEARRLFETLARAGDPVAQVYVAVMLERGQGVPPDYREAARWYRAAAERGHADGQFNLGLLYSKGLGVGRDHVTAARWYRLAAAQGHVRAQLNLGVAYEMGRGMPRDPVAAAGWYRQAARSGSADAQFNLARLYSTGTGVAPDTTAAAAWYREAAERGHVAAQLSLGTAHELGRGVDVDRAEAIRWYRMAAAQGDASAIERLRRLGASVEEPSELPHVADAGKQPSVPAALMDEPTPVHAVPPRPTEVAAVRAPAAVPVPQAHIELPSATRERVAMEVREAPAVVPTPVPDAAAVESVDEAATQPAETRPSLWTRLFAKPEEVEIQPEATPVATPVAIEVVPTPAVPTLAAPPPVVPTPIVIEPTPIAAAPEPTATMAAERAAPRGTVTPGAWSRFWGREAKPASPTAAPEPLVVDVDYPEATPMADDTVVEVPPTRVRIVKSDLGVRPIVEDAVASSQPPVEIEVTPSVAAPTPDQPVESRFWGWWSRLTGARSAEPTEPKTVKLQRLDVEDLSVSLPVPAETSAEPVRGAYGVAVEAEPAASIIAYEREILPSLPAEAAAPSAPQAAAVAEEPVDRKALQRLSDEEMASAETATAEVGVAIAVAEEDTAPVVAVASAPEPEPVVVPAASFESVMERAIAGDAAAQFDVAGRYLRGEGTDEDAVAAAAWYLESAQRGNARAQAQLGVMLDNGRGVGRDPVAAVDWYRRAADQGDPVGQLGLARKFDKGEGVARDAAQAVRLYRKAAEQGNTLAQVNLGVSYATGEGVKRDPIEALSWLTQAARAGEATAQSYKETVSAGMSAADVRTAEARAAARD